MTTEDLFDRIDERMNLDIKDDVDESSSNDVRYVTEDGQYYTRDINMREAMTNILEQNKVKKHSIRGHVYIAKKPKANGYVPKGCVAFEVTEYNRMFIQTSYCHSGSAARNLKPEEFSKETGRRLAYKRLDQDPIEITDIAYVELINHKLIRGIHMDSILNKLVLQDLTNTTLAHVAIETAKTLNIITSGWFILNQHSCRKSK
jgi:hypothetical protein